MLVAHISDTHIVAKGRKTFGFVPMADYLTACVAHINGLSMRPDVVLVTGDITNTGDAAEVRLAADILRDLCCPFYVIPGNHDIRETLWSEFGGAACPERDGPFLSFVVEGFPLRLIALDSTIPGAAGGEICERRANWLSARLAEAPDTPTVIFLHHPPIRCGVPESDQDGFAGADRLAEIVARHSAIERILCGHIHLHTHARLAGTIVTSAPSIGMQLALDLTQARESEFIMDAPAYLLHHYTAGGVLVTHPVRVAGTLPTYPFADGVA